MVNESPSSTKGKKEIVKRLCGTNKAGSTVVAFGAANFSGQGIKGRGLKKTIEEEYGSNACIIDVDKNDTNQTCSRMRMDGTTCGERLSKVGLLHAVRRCQSVEYLEYGCE
jgi:hypothetical protein